jgi:broad specificity phosphatase PhoE
MSLVMIRHGETEWSRSGRHTGRTDVPLTENGRRDAERLRSCLTEWSFVRVLTSPLRRAGETCTLAGLGSRAEVTDLLREWDYGDYEGRTTPDIRKERPGWTLWTDGVPGGETAEQVAARADRMIVEVSRTDGDVALIGHGHMLRVMAARWIGLAAEDGSRFALDPASIGVLGHERETPVLARWNQPCRPATTR